jgi:4-hydroxy-tetrahydrodipicolinate synthase
MEHPENSRFAGVIAPMITPCKNTGEIDFAAISRCAAELSKRGCDGVFVISSTGGMPFLDEEDRQRIVETARQSWPSEKTLYAGISGMGVKQTLRYAKQAKAEGADAAVLMAPFFLRLSQAELSNYILQIADNCPIPVCLYHHVAMRTAIEVETVAKVASHPNVVALKDTSERMDRMEQLVQATRGTKLTLLQGSEPIILKTLQAGGDGCVSALAGVAPEWHRELNDAFRHGDAQQAADAQQKISSLWKMFEFPQMKLSFSYFARSLTLATRYRGWCNSATTVVPGFAPDPEFDSTIEQHLKRVGLER